jgi:uncharacterized membrane protein YkgB
LIRISLGIIYFHFGFLKFYPDLSPAEIIASYTAERLSLHSLDSATVLLVIAILECVIGLGFLFNCMLRWVGLLFFFHMAATFAPIFILPEIAFKFAPLAPTLEGQYVLKNLVLVAAGWVLLEPHFREFWLFRYLRARRTSPLSISPANTGLPEGATTSVAARTHAEASG